MNSSDTSGRQQQIRDDIARLLDAVAEQSRRDISADEFHTTTLHRALEATGANGGGIWMLDGHGNALADGLPARLRLVALAGDGAIRSAATDGQPDWLTDFLCQSASGEGIIVAPPLATGLPGAENPTHESLTAAPFTVGNGPCGVMILSHGDDVSPAFQKGTHQLVSVLIELIGDFHRNLQLKQLRAELTWNRELTDFYQAVLHCDDVSSLVWTVANEARRVLQCDRVTVLLPERMRMRVRCVSGVDRPDDRSAAVQLLEHVATDVARSKTEHWQTTEPIDGTAATDHVGTVDGISHGDADCERASRVRTLLNETGAASVGIIPLSATTDTRSNTNIKPASGVLVIEQFERNVGDSADLRFRAQCIARQSAPVLELLSRVDDLPLIGLARRLRRWRHLTAFRNRRTALCLTFLPIVVAMSLLLIPADFEIEVRGELQPVEQQFFYAPRDGIVTGFPDLSSEFETPDHAAPQVQIGDVVLQLQDTDLDYELTRLLGEHASTLQRMETVTVLRDQLARTPNPDQNGLNQLTADRLEVDLQLKSLALQLDILRQERGRLALTAAIAGQVQTWDFVTRLRSRPVRQGDHLMTIADLDGPWRLKLYLPDRHTGDIRQARSGGSNSPGIRFVLKSAPENHYTATLTDVAEATEHHEPYGLCVPAFATLQREPLPDRILPGTAIVAKIHCGRRSLGSVWLHDLFRSIRQRFLF